MVKGMVASRRVSAFALHCWAACEGPLLLPWAASLRTESSGSALAAMFPKSNAPAPPPAPFCERPDSRGVPVSIPKVRLKKDRALDKVMEVEKQIKPILRIRDLIMMSKRKAIPFRFLYLKKREVGLRTSVERIRKFIQQYPNMLELYMHPKENLEWIRLTKEVLELIEEEKRIHAQQEQVVVEKLSKLLMMASGRRIPMYKLDISRHYFGFPDNFDTIIIPKYPELFCVVHPEQNDKDSHRDNSILQLVKWDKSLAITEFQKKAKENSPHRGVGEVESMEMPLAFKFSYSPGMAIKRKVQEKYAKWQRLPYVSPYQEERNVWEGALREGKRIICFLHEFISLTIEKKIELKFFGLFRKEYELPTNFVKWINRFPGIFYICLKGSVCTVLLRDGYERSCLLEESPLHQLKIKYAKMVQQGPILRSRMLKSRGKNRSTWTRSSKKSWSSESSDEGWVTEKENMT